VSWASAGSVGFKGSRKSTPFAAQTAAENAARKAMDKAFYRMMACAMRFIEELRASGGNIVTVSSTSAFHATRGNPAYNASKAGLVALTRTLGQAWAADGVRVNGLAPGLVDTKLTKVTTEHPERLAASLRNIPMHRLGTPADMAGAALFLASPLASTVRFLYSRLGFFDWFLAFNERLSLSLNQR